MMIFIFMVVASRGRNIILNFQFHKLSEKFRFEAYLHLFCIFMTIGFTIL